MLQVDAEESSGQPSVWRDVYRKMHCPGPPCHHEGQYRWQNPVSKKHYRSRTHHIRRLVKDVEKGGVINTHNDIPETVSETDLSTYPCRLVIRPTISSSRRQTFLSRATYFSVHKFELEIFGKPHKSHQQITRSRTLPLAPCTVLGQNLYPDLRLRRSRRRPNNYRLNRSRRAICRRTTTNQLPYGIRSTPYYLAHLSFDIRVKVSKPVSKLDLTALWTKAFVLPLSLSSWSYSVRPSVNHTLE